MSKKGFSDHNANWLKPSKAAKRKQPEPESEEQEADLDSEDDALLDSSEGERQDRTNVFSILL